MSTKQKIDPTTLTPEMANVRIIMAVTEYDRKQQTCAAKNPRAYYNMYALAHYCGACNKAVEELKAGKPLRAVLVKNFNGTLLNVVLKSVGLEKATDAEQRY